MAAIDTTGNNGTTIYTYYNDTGNTTSSATGAGAQRLHPRRGQRQRHLRSSYDSAAALTTTYFNNASGLVLKRERTQGSQNTKVGSHYYYYADGRRVGDVSDDPSDNPRVSYAEQLATKRDEPADSKSLCKNLKRVSSADFDQNFEPIN